MTELTDQEKAVLRALSELEPATLEELALRTGLRADQIREILDGLAKRGLLTSLNRDASNSDHDNSRST